MLDTLILVVAMSQPVKQRPLVPAVLNETINPIPVKPLSRPESLTTCHESSVGSCWTDK